MVLEHSDDVKGWPIQIFAQLSILKQFPQSKNKTKPQTHNQP